MQGFNKKKFEDTKGIIISCKSKKELQCNSEKKTEQGTHNNLQNTTQK
jgi:hypothetical protein